MLKRSGKVLLLLTAMAVVAGAQTIVPERCQSPETGQLTQSPLVGIPLLPNGFGGSLAALVGQVEPLPFELLSQQNLANPDDGSSLWFSLGPGSYMGVYLDEVTADRVKQLNLKEERGALVTKVMADSPAAKAGIQENDVIVSFNGRPVDSVRELQRLLGDTPSGRTISLEVTRGGSRQTLPVTLAERSVMTPELFRGDAARKYTEQARKQAEDLRKQAEEYKGRLPKTWEFPNYNFVFPQSGLFRSTGRIGVAIESMSDQLASFFGAKEGGVLITEVRENSPAAKAGLKAGDVIVGIDAEKVKEGSDLIRALGQKEEGQVTVKVIRDRSEKSLNVTLEKRERPKTTSQFIRRSIA